MNKNNQSLWRYAGLATQFFVAIALAVYGGLQLDKLLKFRTPLAVWVLPLLLITGLIIKIARETTTKK
jgi:hypothetical protein